MDECPTLGQIAANSPFVLENLKQLKQDMLDTMTVNDVEFCVIKLLGKGKGGYSYLVTDETTQYVRSRSTMNLVNTTPSAIS